MMFALRSLRGLWMAAVMGHAARRRPLRPRPAAGPLAVQALEDRYLLSLSFAPAATLPVGLRPESMVTADLGNGHQDILVLNQGQFPDRVSSLSVLLGNGDGTFQPAITTSLPPGATSLAVGDFNRDGKLDVAVTNGLDNSVEILHGNGDGTFQPNPLIIPVGTQGNFLPTIASVAVGDFAHNGKLDLAVANPGSNTVSVLLGNGDGTFQPRVDLAVGTAPVSVAASDLGNRQIDLVVADHDSSQVSVLLGNGDGTFQAAQNIGVDFPLVGTDSHPLTLKVADFSGNGKPDVLINQFVGQDAGVSVLTVLPGDGHGGFQAPIKLDTGGGTFLDLAVGDFNGDGKLDFAVTDFGADAVVFAGNGDGTFAPPVFFPSGGSNLSGLAAADFTGSGLPDLVVANTFSNTIGVLLNTSGQVVGAATTTTLKTSVPSAVFGQTETLTATVTSPAGTPTGTVTFFDGQTALGRATLNAAGQATLTVSLGVGSHVLTASFGGTSAFAASTSPAVTETVNPTSPSPTTTALTSSVTTAVAGQSQTLTATVTSSAATPSGTVTFFDGSTALGRAPLGGNGQATLTVSLGVGAHSVTASFAGNSAFAASTSAAVADTVSRAATRTALSALAGSVSTGQSVTFTATIAAVAPGAGTPTGTVTFRDGNVVLGTATIGAGGQAILSTGFSATGRHTITAVYSGDSNFMGSSSQAITEQVSAAVSPAATTTALVASANPVRVGQTVTFTATVSGPAGTGTPTGTITFFVGNREVARVRLDATGKARLTGHFLARGRFIMRAVYSGDSSFAASSQAIIEQVR